MSINILITSPPDRQKVVAELWVDDVQIAEVSNDYDELRVEFYSAPVPNQLSLSFTELIEALEQAKRNLVS
jgi:hypothetical protein